jgi:hypothetical protein
MLNKNVSACIATIVVCWCLPAEGGGNGPAGPCPKGPDGCCVPNRVLWGYYPTTWRRWPTDRPAPAAKSEPELLPTPAMEPPKGETPLEKPGASTEAPIIPTQIEPSMPQPETELPGRSEDGPPEPPRESRGTAEPPQEVTPPMELVPPEDFNEPPARPEASPSQQKTTSPVPDDNPFKDEAPTSDDAPPAPPKSGARGDRTRSVLGQREPIRWRVTAKGQTASAQSSQLKSVNSSEEPRRLKPLQTDGAADRALLPINIAKANPFRATNSQTRDDRVMSTANWSPDKPVGDRPVADAGPAIWRPNPLRSN